MEGVDVGTTGPNRGLMAAGLSVQAPSPARYGTISRVPSYPSPSGRVRSATRRVARAPRRRPALPRFFLTLAEGIVGFVAVAAILITLLEKPWTFESVFDSFNWGLSTVLGVQATRPSWPRRAGGS